MIDLQGAYTALVTPFLDTPDELPPVDYDRLTANIRDQAVAGITGIVPCGTTGETPTLRPEESRRVIEHATEVARPLGLKVVAGAGSNSTAEAVEHHRFVQSVGADAALHVTPYYNKPSQRGLERHFLTIADSCDLPIVLYNIPGRTAVALALPTIARLARHPNIHAVKEASGSLDFAARIASETDLTVLSGDDPMTLAMATVGGRGVISVVANLLPGPVAALVGAFLTGDWERARDINTGLVPLGRALLTLDTNPVPLKTAMHLVGRDSGVLRLPLCPPEPAVIEQLRVVLETFDLEPIGLPA